MKISFASAAPALFPDVISAAVTGEGIPGIRFEPTSYDFGKTSHIATGSGAFKFAKAGGGLLRREPPRTSCRCTVAAPPRIEAPVNVKAAKP